MSLRLCPLCCAAILVALSATLAPAEIFLRLEGGGQGWIEGDATQQGHEDWIEVQDFSHSITIPTAPDGSPTGPPVTSPIFLGKSFDRSTVLLFRAVSQSEMMSVFVLEFMRTAQGGQQELYFIIRLWGGRLTQLSQGGGASSEPVEQATFVYQYIELEDPITGTYWSYDWNGGNTATPEPLAKGLLLPPAPNPTQGHAEFRFALPVASNAELTLFDLRGRLVKELHRGFTPAEPVLAVWDGTDGGGVKVAQGLYIARLSYPGTVVTQRITVVR